MQSSLQFDRITVRLSPPVAHLSLAHAPVNVIDLQMMDELSSALAEIDTLPAISIVVLSGSGKCFSTGVDVAAHTPDKVGQMLEKFHPVIRSFIATRKVTLAVVHGNCLGGGAELAMVCDIVVTADDATWGFPEITLGCFPPVAATALHALIGQKRAAELILTGRSVSGSEAAAMGLASSAVPAAELDRTVDETIARLTALSPATLATAKKAIYAWDSMHFDKGLARAEKIYKEELMHSEDAQEGIRAFLEKRRPQWKNR